MLVSFIIPAYNEATRLSTTLPTVLAYLNAQPYASEVLLVDDGSDDATARLAQQFFEAHGCPHVRTRVLSYQPNRGKGYAVRQGLLAAQGELAVFSDADLSTPITELPRLLDPLLAGQYDVVFGSRALDRRVVGVPQPWWRDQGGRFFNVVMRWLTGLPYGDTQCGFKAYRLAPLRPLAHAARLAGFGFDVELLLLAHHAGLRLLELPVRWNNAAGSKVSLGAGLRSCSDVWQLRRWLRRGYYSAALRQARAAGLALVLPRPAQY
ncbi:glycosyltransferase family 2 protein [Hymenobacter sp. RP-2-7]|uniref:dolichyl-phosphate beta-glucosyltransferase n=1 Tax=Hymenobacter polaris TaxID=2682546 RepID=A0A7Y0AHH9_9BACT|nr:dolichyl-phosphate beta-glucosyltransferase [Hymenobacter polaris]NML67432.1 glycosyltransferase family 2 protein [Hymenobacter polaris]